MLKKLFNAILTYPVQVFLFVFNTGVFAWLQATGASISEKIGLTDAWNQYVPDTVKNIVGSSTPAVQAFFSNSAVIWLIGSMIILLIIRFVKGLIKFILVLLLILVGIFLIYRYQSLLQQLLQQ